MPAVLLFTCSKMSRLSKRLADRPSQVPPGVSTSILGLGIEKLMLLGGKRAETLVWWRSRGRFKVCVRGCNHGSERRSK